MYEGGATYRSVCIALREAYGGAAQRYYFELEGLRKTSTETLAEFNTRFTKLRSKAGPYLN